MAFRLGMADSRPIKNSFSFYAADMTALDERVEGLKKAGVNARSATVLRALIHLTSPAEMIAHAVRLAGDSALGVATSDDDVIAGGATKIFTNAPAGRVLLGYPAVKMETHVEMQKALRRLPRLAAKVAEIERVVIPKSSSTD